MPPLQWSICKQFVVKACTDTPLDKYGGDGGVYGGLFAVFDTKYNETETKYVCNHDIQQIPNHSNTTSFFWNKLTERSQYYRLTSFIAEIDIWNRSSFTWDPIYVLKYANGTEMSDNINIFR